MPIVVDVCWGGGQGGRGEGVCSKTRINNNFLVHSNGDFR